MNTTYKSNNNVVYSCKYHVGILQALAVTFRGRAVGLSTIASSVGEDPSTIEDVYEPYLLQRGLIVRTPQGRQATLAAFEHLGVTPPASA